MSATPPAGHPSGRGAIDWTCELGSAADGSKVYPSVEALRKEHNVVSECGIVKVRVQFLEVIEQGDVL